MLVHHWNDPEGIVSLRFRDWYASIVEFQIGEETIVCIYSSYSYSQAGVSPILRLFQFLQSFRREQCKHQNRR